MICTNGLDTFDTNPVIYITLMRVSAVTTLPINLYGLYCVIYKTSSDLLEHRRILFIHQVAVTYLDLHTSAIVAPVVFFPLPFGTSFGLLRLQRLIGFEIIFLWTLIAISLMACSAMLLFHYRLHTVAPPGHFFKVQSRTTVLVFRVFICSFFTVFFVAAYLLVPQGDLKQQTAEILSNYPCAIKLMGDPLLQMIDANLFKVLVLMESVLCIMMLVAAIIFVGIAQTFLSNSSTMSKQTIRLQRKFQRSLVIQVFGPIAVTLVLSTTLTILSLTGEVPLQSFSNAFMFMYSFYGATSTVIMIVFNANYLQYTKYILKKTVSILGCR